MGALLQAAVRDETDRIPLCPEGVDADVGPSSPAAPTPPARPTSPVPIAHTDWQRAVRAYRCEVDCYAARAERRGRPAAAARALRDRLDAALRAGPDAAGPLCLTDEERRTAAEIDAAVRDRVPAAVDDFAALVAPRGCPPA